MHLACMWSRHLSSSLRNLCWFVGLIRVARIFFPRVDKCRQVALGSPAFSICSYTLLLQLRLNLQVVTNTPLFVKEILQGQHHFSYCRLAGAWNVELGRGIAWCCADLSGPAWSTTCLSPSCCRTCRVNFSFVLLNFLTNLQGHQCRHLSFIYLF